MIRRKILARNRVYSPEYGSQKSLSLGAFILVGEAKDKQNK